MTPEERNKLNATHDMMQEMHRALFAAPMQGGDPPYKRIISIVETLETGGKAGKWILRGVMGLAALGVAVANIKGWNIWR